VKEGRKEGGGEEENRLLGCLRGEASMQYERQISRREERE